MLWTDTHSQINILDNKIFIWYSMSDYSRCFIYINFNSFYFSPHLWKVHVSTSLHRRTLKALLGAGSRKWKNIQSHTPGQGRVRSNPGKVGSTVWTLRSCRRLPHTRLYVSELDKSALTEVDFKNTKLSEKIRCKEVNTVQHHLYVGCLGGSVV